MSNHHVISRLIVIGVFFIALFLLILIARRHAREKANLAKIAKFQQEDEQSLSTNQQILMQKRWQMTERLLKNRMRPLLADRLWIVLYVENEPFEAAHDAVEVLGDEHLHTLQDICDALQTEPTDEQLIRIVQGEMKEQLTPFLNDEGEERYAPVRELFDRANLLFGEKLIELTRSRSTEAN